MAGRQIVILLGCCATGLALAGCSDDNGGDKVAGATKTVTVTAPAADSPSKAKKEARKGEAKGKSAKGNVATSPTVADIPKKVDKGAATSGSGGKQAGAGDTVPPGKVQATNSSPPEVTLAVIDAESAYVKKSTVRRYAVLLDRLEASCTEARVLLAKFALAASNDTKGMNVRLSILDVLKEVVASHPSGACADAFTRVARRDAAP